VLEAKKDLDGMIDTLDLKMNQVVKQVELSYLDGFNHFVQEKEKDVDQIKETFLAKNTLLNRKE